MNFKITILILLLSKCVLGSCADVFTDLKHKVVNFKQDCVPESKPCVVKCCGENQVIRKLRKKYKCRDVEQLMTEIKGLDKFREKISTYKDLNISNTNGNVSKEFRKDFNLLQSKIYTENLNSVDFFVFRKDMVQFMENGTILIKGINSTLNAPDFCVDMVLITRKGVPDSSYVYIVKTDDQSVEINQSLYVAYGSMISSFFIFLVLLVYGLLKDLHGCVHGLLLMTFIATLMSFYLTQGCRILYEVKLNTYGLDTTNYLNVCKWIKPIDYFLIISTLTWLNTMSFDIWRRFRDTRSRNNTSKDITRAIVMKFLRYSLYGWGLPLAMTIAAVLIDLLADDSIIKPGLDNCQNNSSIVAYQNLYKKIPIGILVCSNIMFYLMTIYNIWVVSRSMTRLRRADSSKTRKNNNQLKLFTNLFAIMGVGWIIELAQMPISGVMDFWLFCLLNTYNVFIGVVFFFVMICKRNVFIKLCNRFDIKNRWTNHNPHSKGSARTDSSKASRGRATDDSIEIESTQLSHADTMKDVKQSPMQKPRFTVSWTQTKL